MSKNIREFHYFCSFCKNNTDPECSFNSDECCCTCDFCDACNGCEHEEDIPDAECPCKCDLCEVSIIYKKDV
jgi:hypothetical protein